MKNSLRKLEQEDTEAVYRMKEREAYQQVLNNINLGYIDPIKLIEMIFDEGLITLDEGLITLEEIERVIGAIRYAASGEGGRIELTNRAMKNIIIITAEAEKILNGIADIKERKTALDAVEKRMKEKHIGMITGTDVYTTFLEQGRLDTPDMFE